MHSLFSYQKWFEAIEIKTKIMEGRLMMNVKIGDEIQFNCGKSSLVRKVTSVTNYSCFAEMLDVEGIENTLPGVTSMKDAVDIFKDMYPNYIQRKHGVVAIGIK